MRIVLAGATGFIGSALVPALVGAGHEVVVLTRSAKKAVGAAAMVVWDGRSVDAGALAGADAVVNLSGATIAGTRWTARRKRGIVSSRVESTAAIVDAIAQLRPEQRPRVLVNASGIDYAGDAGDEIVDESVRPGETFLASVCVEWEAAALAAEALGLRVVLMRTPVVFARDALALKLMALPFRLLVGGRLGSGRQWFPWIHLADAVRLYISAIEDDALQGPVHMVAPEAVRQADVAREIGRALHRPSILPAPGWALKLGLGEQSDLLLGGQHAVSRKLAAGAFLYPRLADALAEALR